MQNLFAVLSRILILCKSNDHSSSSWEPKPTKNSSSSTIYRGKSCFLSLSCVTATLPDDNQRHRQPHGRRCEYSHQRAHMGGISRLGRIDRRLGRGSIAVGKEHFVRLLGASTAYRPNLSHKAALPIVGHPDGNGIHRIVIGHILCVSLHLRDGIDVVPRHCVLHSAKGALSAPRKGEGAILRQGRTLSCLQW